MIRVAKTPESQLVAHYAAREYFDRWHVELCKEWYNVCKNAKPDDFPTPADHECVFYSALWMSAEALRAERKIYETGQSVLEKLQTELGPHSPNYPLITPGRDRCVHFEACCCLELSHIGWGAHLSLDALASRVSGASLCDAALAWAARWRFDHAKDWHEPVYIPSVELLTENPLPEQGAL